MRTLLQFVFLSLTLAGVYGFAGNAERWCPFGGVEGLYTYISEGNLTCSLAVSNFYILGGVLIITLVLRRAFCGYMCPIGTISDWVQRTTARLKVQPLAVPRWLDKMLSFLKYSVLVVVLFLTYRASELVFRGFDPCYALISRHGEDITYWAYIVAGAIVLGSIILTMPFCRWLCPLAVVLNPFSRVGLARIKRDDTTCLQCGKCSRACPMAIPVHEVSEVTAARCISCLRCVEVCPGRGDGAVTWGPPARMGRRWPSAVLVLVLLFCTTAAVAAAHLFPIPSFVATRGQLPVSVETTELGVAGLTCRGRANLLTYFVERDDTFELMGYLKLEVWPGPGAARARITYEPSLCNADAIKRAVTEPYYDAVAGKWRWSPFEIEGFDPVAVSGN